MLLRKEVIIQSSGALAQDESAEGSGYIDPSLILSQNSFQRRQQKQSSGFDMSVSSSVLFSSSMQPPPTESSTENDLSVILSQVKAIHHPVASASQSLPSHKRSIADVFSRSTSEITGATRPPQKSAPAASHSLLHKSESTLLAKLREKSLIPNQKSADPHTRSESKRFVGLHASDSFSASQRDLVAYPSKELSQPSQTGSIRSYFSQDLSQTLDQSQKQGVEPASSSAKSKKEFKHLIG